MLIERADQVRACAARAAVPKARKVVFPNGQERPVFEQFLGVLKERVRDLYDKIGWYLVINGRALRPIPEPRLQLPSAGADRSQGESDKGDCLHVGLTLALSGRAQRYTARGRRNINGALAARRSRRLHRPLERVVRCQLLQMPEPIPLEPRYREPLLRAHERELERPAERVCQLAPECTLLPAQTGRCQRGNEHPHTDLRGVLLPGGQLTLPQRPKRRGLRDPARGMTEMRYRCGRTAPAHAPGQAPAPRSFQAATLQY